MIDNYSRPMLDILSQGLDLGDGLRQAQFCTPTQLRRVLAYLPSAKRDRLYNNLVSHRWSRGEISVIAETLFPDKHPGIPGSDDVWSLSHSQGLAKVAPSLVGLLPSQHLPLTLPIALSVGVSALDNLPQEGWGALNERDLVDAPGSLLARLESLSCEPWKQALLTPAVVRRLVRDFENDPADDTMMALVRCAQLARIGERDLLFVTKALISLGSESLHHTWNDLLGLMAALSPDSRRPLFEEIPPGTLSVSLWQLASFDPETQGLILSKGHVQSSTLTITNREALEGFTEGVAAGVFAIPPKVIVRFVAASTADLGALLGARSVNRAGKDWSEGNPYQTPLTPALKQQLFDSPGLVETMVREHGMSLLAPDYIAANPTFLVPILRGLADRGQDRESLKQYLAILDRAMLLPQDDSTSNFDLWANLLGPYLVQDTDEPQIRFLQDMPENKKEAMVTAYRASLLSERAAQSPGVAPHAPNRRTLSL